MHMYTYLRIRGSEIKWLLKVKCFLNKVVSGYRKRKTTFQTGRPKYRKVHKVPLCGTMYRKVDNNTARVFSNIFIFADCVPELKNNLGQLRGLELHCWIIISICIYLPEYVCLVL